MSRWAQWRLGSSNAREGDWQDRDPANNETRPSVTEPFRQSIECSLKYCGPPYILHTARFHRRHSPALMTPSSRYRFDRKILG